MNPSINECYKLFEIDDIQTITEHDLKKKYHKLCLKYHPDRNKNIDTNKFLHVKACYEKLIYIKNNDFDKKTNNNEFNFYDYLLSFINIDNLEKIVSWINNYSDYLKERDVNIIKLHVDIEQLFSKDLYLYEDVYIPLWYKSIFLNDIKKNLKMDLSDKNVLFYVELKKCLINVNILENNDILIYCNKDLLNHKIIKVKLTNSLLFEFENNSSISNDKYYIMQGKGIPCISKENVYDISKMSSLIFCFV